jgi:hypothetical protein
MTPEKIKIDGDALLESYSPVMHEQMRRIMAQVIINLGRDVLSADINQLSFASLALKKAKYEGAEFLLNSLDREIARLVALDTGEEDGRQSKPKRRKSR